MTDLAERIARRITANSDPVLRPAINATGCPAAPRGGDPPLAEAAVEAMAAAARDYGASGEDFAAARGPLQLPSLERHLQE